MIDFRRIARNKHDVRHPKLEAHLHLALKVAPRGKVCEDRLVVDLDGDIDAAPLASEDSAVSTDAEDTAQCDVIDIEPRAEL